MKLAVAGHGGADKEQVQLMVTRLLRLGAVPRPPDAADALALALCHQWAAPLHGRIADAPARGAARAVPALASDERAVDRRRGRAAELREASAAR